MQTAITFTPDESTFIVAFVEACHAATLRHDLVFSIYPKLHALLPHTRFSCSISAIDSTLPVYTIHCPDSYDGRMSASYRCLSAALVRTWMKTMQPFYFDAARTSPDTAESAWLEALRPSLLANVAGHGVLDHTGKAISFFVFTGVVAWDSRQEFMLRLLTPHLHVALGTISRFERNLELVQLSGREKEMLNWICSGKSNIEIAGIVGISPWTVKIHVRKMMSKLDVCSRSQAVARAYQLGIIGQQSP